MKRVITFLLVPAIAMFTLKAQVQLSGTIQTKSNEPLAGAIISVDGSKQTDVADNTGGYQINLSQGQHVVKVSYIGFENIIDTLNITTSITKNYTLSESVTSFEEIVVSSVRAQNNTPTTFTLINKKALSKVNLGHDAPYLLALEPSVTTTSDAGTGIGYTGMRIRGIESSKINVTINGVPLNDAESHGVYWVDVPDVAGSAQSIQIQRGVGTSTNGSGAFGASINLQTDNISQKAFYEYSGAAGSFNTLKNSLHFGSGLINNHWFLEGKVSGIKSDGYIDRGWSNLKSYFGQTGYYSDKTIVKLVAFGGWEETYQAWYGVDSATMANPKLGRKYNWAGAYTDKDGNTKFYDNFIDHYQQDHLQLHVAHKFNSRLSANAALHYTYGRGYYEEYMENQDLNFYGMDYRYTGKDSISKGNYFYHDTLKTTSLVRRLWLDNKFYGGIWGLTYTDEKIALTWGGGISKYDNAQHFGQVVWANIYTADSPNKEFYRNVGNKSDANTFVKANYYLFDKLSVFTDIQYRFINYTASGINKEWTDNVINIDKKYSFINPKVGALYSILPHTNLYSSFAVANREPNRGDFIDDGNNGTPKPERLYDLELGIRHNENNLYLEGVFYNMMYHNQLIATGELNSVGAFIRKNIENSYRRGIELIADYQPNQLIKLGANVTVSDNKGVVLNDGKYSTLAMSPSLISGEKIVFYPFKGFDCSLINKYVGKQYLDNTESELKKLDAYNVVDVLASYSVDIKGVGKIGFTGRIINLFDAQYISNGNVKSYGTYYYPQAGRHYLAGITLKF